MIPLPLVLLGVLVVLADVALVALFVRQWDLRAAVAEAVVVADQPGSDAARAGSRADAVSR